MSRVTNQPTVPDVDALWTLVEGLPPALGDVARWRITTDDWAYLRANHPRAIGYPIRPDRPYTLFGVPVDVVATERHRWPELVLISDRRNRDPRDV